MRQFLLLLLLLAVNVQANEIFTFKLTENQKLEGTFSGSLSNNETIHFVIVKNKSTKKFDILPFYIEASGTLKQMETVSFKKAPSVISYHKSGNIITVINYDEDKTLQVTDFDVNTLKATLKSIKDFSDPKNIFRLNNKTVVIQHQGNKGKLDINEITNTQDITTRNIKATDEQLKNFKLFFKEEPQAVNTNEFVKNGAITELKSYFTGNDFIITKDDKKEGVTNVMTINTVTGNIVFKSYLNKTEKQRDITSFISGNNLFSIGLNKEDMNLKSFDLATGTEKTTYNISALAKNFKANVNQAAFLKEATKSSMTPTVTVNKAGKKYAVRIDAVNRETYSYNYNWWHLHWMMQQQLWMQQQWMLQQQHQTRMMNMGGPGHKYFDRFITDYTEKKDISFTVLLDENLQLLDEYDNKTDFTDIDKDKYLNIYKDDKSVKQLTAAFLDTEVRCIYQNKKSNEIVITTTPL